MTVSEELLGLADNDKNVMEREIYYKKRTAGRHALDLGSLCDSLAAVSHTKGGSGQ
jgi:hypothetical protein